MVQTPQTTGADHQIADLDLLVRYSFYPHLISIWSSSQRDCIGHDEQPRFLHNGRSKTRAPVIIDGWMACGRRAISWIGRVHLLFELVMNSLDGIVFSLGYAGTSLNVHNGRHQNA